MTLSSLLPSLFEQVWNRVNTSLMSSTANGCICAVSCLWFEKKDWTRSLLEESSSYAAVVRLGQMSFLFQLTNVSATFPYVLSCKSVFSFHSFKEQMVSLPGRRHRVGRQRAKLS
jgi:hypothetical protein